MKKRTIKWIALMITVMMTLSIGTSNVFSATADDITDVGALNNYSLGYMSWGVKAMGLDVLQEKLEKSGKELPEVIVAVLDTGLNTDNRYLEGRYIDGYNFLDDTSDYNDKQYHGTEVCGVIADGTSSNVKILPIKVMEQKGDSKMTDTAKAIYYALDHGADVINLSLSGDDKNHTYHSLDNAIAEAVSRGVVVTVAAGNQDGDASLRYPANKDNVITVTSVYKNNTLGLFANTGSVIDFALPGMNILVPHRTFMLLDSGTSFAAPHAAAAAALLKTWDKSLNQAEIYEIFKQHAVDLGDKGFDTTFGWGMIDLSDFDINATYVRPTEPVTEPSTQPVTPFLLGDADGNDLIESIDTTYLLRYLADEDTPFSSDELLRGDVDQNGMIEPTDITAIQFYLSELTVSYKIGERIN